jgi:hypothetical protein
MALRPEIARRFDHEDVDMAVFANFIPQVTKLLRTAATREATIPFAALHGIFPDGTRSPDVYDTLEAACTNIVSMREANYSALLAKKGDGLPGTGFFDSFQLLQEDEYAEIAGRAHVLDLTQEQRQEMTKRERQRVYEHAKL